MSLFVRSIAASVLALCVALFAQASFADDWVVVAPGDGKYVIQMPGQPKQQTQKINTAAGPADLFQYIVEVSNDEAYISSYIEYSSKVVVARSPQDHLKVAQEGTIKGLPGSKVLVEKETNVGDHPGRVFVLDLGNDSVYTAAIYLVNNRLYQNVAVTPKAMAGGPKVVKFLESFVVYKE
ncbi:MAG: hypothetical protein ABI439_00330 [Rhodospirillales bacterium]